MNLYVGIAAKGSKADIHRDFLEISNAIGATPEAMFRDGMGGPVSYKCLAVGPENVVCVKDESFKVRIIEN